MVGLATQQARLSQNQLAMKAMRRKAMKAAKKDDDDAAAPMKRRRAMKAKK